MTQWTKNTRLKAGGSYRCIECTRESNRLWGVNNSKARTLHKLKARAKSSGLDFNLTEEDLVIPIVCPVLAIPLTALGGGGIGGSDNSPSVDRIDNSKGYTKGNIVIVSNRANKIKRDSTLAELNLIVNFYNNLVPLSQP